jgi:hypothetical protein
MGEGLKALVGIWDETHMLCYRNGSFILRNSSLHRLNFNLWLCADFTDDSDVDPVVRGPRSRQDSSHADRGAEG